ncbi:MAG: pyrroline-5-carboxylate reductase [Pseudomonadota bacterium]
MQTIRVTFIGGGNMAGALIQRLATLTLENDAPAYACRVADPSPEQRQHLATLPGVTTFADNNEAIEGADCVVLAVKPQIMRAVCTEAATAVAATTPLIVSVAAGIGCDQMSHWFDGYRRVVRVMPNTPALLGVGATGLYGDRAVTEADRALADALFSAVGVTAWVDQESLIDAVTAVSGSGPAYFFYLLEAMEDAGRAQGLPTAMAQTLARQTALGAAHMALAERDTLHAVRDRVTSPGGTTAAALDVLASRDLPSIMREAMDAANARAVELAHEFGSD